jgi:hypothetical protein
MTYSGANGEKIQETVAKTDVKIYKGRNEWERPTRVTAHAKSPAMGQPV